MIEELKPDLGQEQPAEARLWNRRALHDMLVLEELGQDRFAARFNAPNAYSSLFGGQILGQAAVAASSTVEGQELHSIHATFLRSGSPAKPVHLAVERVRDGRRVSCRQVRVLQDDAVLAIVTCSHRLPLGGFDHYQPAATDADPQSAPSLEDLATAEDRERTTLIIGGEDLPSIEVRIPERSGYFKTQSQARRRYWLRAPSLSAFSEPELHRHALAYMSDYLLPGASLIPHALPLPGKHVFVASLDHSLWFHRPVRCDEWLLFETESPSASNGIGLSRALIHNESAVLVATVAQEAMQLAVSQP